jgi:hypothetical protein
MVTYINFWKKIISPTVSKFVQKPQGILGVKKPKINKNK